MDINQATHQKQRLKRIVALCEFIPANTAAVRQDVVVPHDKLDVQDGRVLHCRGPSHCGDVVTPHVGSETKLGLAIDGARQVDSTTVLDGALGVGLDTKVQRVHLAVATSRVAVVRIRLHLLVEGSILLRVDVGTVGGEPNGGKCRPGTVTDVIVGTTVVEVTVGSHLRAVLRHNVHDRASVLQSVGTESVLSLLSDGVLDALASLDDLGVGVGSESISLLWAQEEHTRDNRDGEIFLGKITCLCASRKSSGRTLKIAAAHTGCRKSGLTAALTSPPICTNTRHASGGIGASTGVVADQSRERFQVDLDNQVVVHVGDKRDTHGRVTAKGEDQWAVLALECHGVSLKLLFVVLGKTQHGVGHVDLVEQVPRVQGVLVVTVHALSTQLILDTLDHSHGNTITVVRLTLSLAHEVASGIGSRCGAFIGRTNQTNMSIRSNKRSFQIFVCTVRNRRCGVGIAGTVLEVADTGKVDGDQGLLVDVAVARGGVSQGLTQVGAGTLVKVLEEPSLTERRALLGAESEVGHGRLSGTELGKRSLRRKREDRGIGVGERHDKGKVE